MMTVETKKLKQAISLCARIARRKTTMPILAYTNLKIEENRVTLTVTDLANYFECTVFGSWNGLPQSAQGACVNVSSLQKLVSGSKAKTIDLEYRDQSLPHGGLVRMLFINGAQLVTMPASEYPDAPQEKSEDPSIALEINNEWINALEPVRVAYSRDQTRYNLNGVCFQQSKKDFYAVATDGCRLATVPLKHAGIAPKVGKDLNSWIMCADAVEFLAALSKVPNLTANLTLRPIRATLDGECNTMKIRARLSIIDGVFPSWEQVIPRDKPTLQISTIDKQTMINAIAPCAAFWKQDGSDPHCAGAFNFGPEKCTIVLSSPNTGNMEQTFNSYRAPDIADNFKIGANVNYMLDAVQSCKSDGVRVTFHGATSAIVIDDARKDSFDLKKHGGSVVMPVRLDRLPR